MMLSPASLIELSGGVDDVFLGRRRLITGWAHAVHGKVQRLVSVVFINCALCREAKAATVQPHNPSRLAALQSVCGPDKKDGATGELREALCAVDVYGIEHALRQPGGRRPIHNEITVPEPHLRRHVHGSFALRRPQTCPLAQSRSVEHGAPRLDC
jgi:hypothetical protein